MLSPTRGLLSSSALSKNRGTALALLGGEDERKLADGDMGMEYILAELANLRRTSAEQAQRITTYENLLMSQGSLSETIQSDLSGRISDLEKKATPQSAISDANLYRETDKQQFIKAKYDDMIYDRLGKLEEATQELRVKLDESAVSDIGKMLETTLDHVSSLGSLTDKVKKRGDQAVMILESLLQALTASSGVSDGDFESSMLDFFAHVTTTDNGNLQQKRVVNLLMDSLQKTVDKSIRDQMGPAIECLNDLFTPQLQIIESSFANKVADIDFNVKSSHAAFFSRFEKNETALSDIQRSVSNCESAVTLNFRDEHSNKDKMKSFEESLRSLQVLTQEQKEMLSVVSTKHHSRQTQALDVAGAKDSVKRMQDSLDSHSKNHNTLKNELEDVKFDLLQAIEKHHVRAGENEEGLTRIKEETKEEYQSLRLSHKQMQGLIEQQVGELTRKFNKMEGKIDKVKISDAMKVEGGSSMAVAPAVVNVLPEQLSAMEETCKILSDGQEELRQSLVNITFDFDDMKDLQKSHEKAISYMKATAASPSPSPDPAAVQSSQPPSSPPESTEAEVTTLREKVESIEKAIESLRVGMDALQDEIVMLAPPEPESTTTSPQKELPLVPEGKVNSSAGKVEDPPDIYEGMTFYSAKSNKVPIGTKREAPASKDGAGAALSPSSLPDKEDLSSDSDFASSSSEGEGEDDDDDDIIGVNPKKQEEKEDTPAAADASSPTPSDVLADQLRIRADLEREEALKRVAANKARHASPPSKGPISGPSMTSLGRDSSSSVSQSIVSGSLLTGAGRRASRGSGSGPPLSSASDSTKPIYESLSSTPPPPPPQQTTETFDVGARKDTVQCTHCLRRLPKNAITAHSKTCELRTELCPNGCGAKLLVLKMQKHLEICAQK